MLRRSKESESCYRTVRIDPTENDFAFTPLTFGLCDEGHGIEPQLLPFPDGTGALVAIDDELIAVDTHTGDDVFRISLGRSLVQSMMSVDDQSKFLVFHEIGAALIDDTGRIVWNFSRDVVISSSVVEDVIHLSFIDEPPARISLHSGLELTD